MPELTKRMRSIDGMSVATRAASCVSSSVGAPKLVPLAAAAASALRRSFRRVAMDQRSPGHHIVDVVVAVDVLDVRASARLMKSGVPPTPLNARTGLSTPPGSSRDASAKNLDERAYLERFRRSIRRRR